VDLIPSATRGEDAPEIINELSGSSTLLIASSPDAHFHGHAGIRFICVAAWLRERQFTINAGRIASRRL